MLLLTLRGTPTLYYGDELARPLTRDDVLSIVAQVEGRKILNRMQLARDVEKIAGRARAVEIIDSIEQVTDLKASLDRRNPARLPGEAEQLVLAERARAHCGCGRGIAGDRAGRTRRP